MIYNDGTWVPMRIVNSTWDSVWIVRCVIFFLWQHHCAKLNSKDSTHNYTHYTIYILHCRTALPPGFSLRFMITFKFQVAHRM